MIARVHARGWLGVPGQPTTIAAIADTSPDALQEFGEFFDVADSHRYPDFREMLDAERPDFVDVCSWHAQHSEMVIASAARRPKATICQKPMAIDLGEADRMITGCGDLAGNGFLMILSGPGQTLPQNQKRPELFPLGGWQTHFVKQLENAITLSSNLS